MKLDSTTIEKLAVNHLELELLSCPQLNPVINTDDKGISWDGEIQFFYNRNKKKSYWGGRCPIQVKGHAVSESELKKRKITYPVNIEDLKVYQQDGGVLYFVVYILDDEIRQKYKIFYNEFLPIDIGNILAFSKDDQKTKNLPFMPFPKGQKDKETIVTQFIRDKGLQGHAAYEYPIYLQNALSKESTYTFWASKDFSFLGSQRPTYIYEKSKERNGVYFAVGRVCFESMIAHDVPMNVKLDGRTYFDNAHVELKSKGKVKAIFFNRGLSLGNLTNKKTAKIRLTQKCSFDDYLRNLKFILELSKGKLLSIDGFGEGLNFDFDSTPEQIADEIAYMEGINRLLQQLHVVKKVNVKDLTPKNLTNLHYLYRAIVLKESFCAKGDVESVIGIYTVGEYKFLIIKLINNDNTASYIDGFSTEGMHCEMSDVQEERHPTSIYVRMKKEHFLTLDNIYYPEIIRSITEIDYSTFHGNLVNCLILEMLDAYDEAHERKLLDTVVEIVNWLYDKERTTIYFLNKMQAIKRQRDFSEEEETLIRDFRAKETDDFLLAGFAAVLGNTDDYHYYLGKLNEVQRNRFLMYPIKNLVKEG